MEYESRLLEAINKLSLAERGTLWNVKDNVWERAIEDFECKRISHPGLSISRKRYTSLFDTVPMMIGTSKYKPGGFWVENVMPNAKVKKTLTFFNVIRPRPIPADEVPPMTIEAFMGNNDDVKRNTDKSRLNQEEMVRLDCYLHNRGIDA